MRKFIIILIVVLLTAAGAIGIYTKLPKRPTRSTSNPPMVSVQATIYPVPDSIQPIATRLGLDKTELSKIHILTPADANSCKTGDLSTAVACHGWHTITYPQTLLQEDPIEQDRVLAHEYMHEIWANMSVQDRNSLIPSINQAYASQPILNNRLQGYTLNDQSRADELHSFICTEMNDSEIPQPLLGHCKKYLPNRMALPTYY